MYNFQRLNTIVNNSEKSLNTLHKINDEITENDDKINTLVNHRKNLKLKLKNKQKEFSFSLNNRNIDLYKTIKKLKLNESDD